MLYWGQMKIYIKTVFSLLVLFVFWGLSYSATPTGIKIGEVDFDTEARELSIKICNWDRNDKNLGDYYLWVMNGGKKVKKTFSANYILNYSCGFTTITTKELDINKTGTFDIRIRLESVAGKLKDQKNTSFFIEGKKRFIVPDEPYADIVIENLEFDNNTKIITAKICNKGENYRVSYKYYLSTLFVYNNNKAKSLLKEKDIWADSCWEEKMDVRKLKITKPGVYKIEVIADGGNAIEEKTSNEYDTSKEDNNRKEIEITIEKSKKVEIKHRKKTPIKKDMSSMSLRERIAFMRKNKSNKRILKKTQKRKVSKKSSRRRSYNYKVRKVKTRYSKLKSKYPYLFR